MAAGVVTDAVLAIDLGTSAAKFLLVDGSGTVIARQRKRHRTFTPEDGSAEQDPHEWWQNIGVASRAIITQHGQGHRVAAIAVTGQMHGLVTRDASGRSVGNAITWQDRRSAITLPSLLDQLPSDHWAKIGERVAPGYQAASWHCVSQSDPARLATAAKLLLPKDEIIARLSGRYVTDHSDAIGTGWYDVSTKTWDTAVCDAAGFRVSALPEIVAPGSIIGSLSKEAASHLDLDPGIPVVIAGGDAAVAAFGSGAMESGTPLLMLSTGTQILEATWSNDLAATWPSANPSGLPTRLRVTTTLTGGNTIDWSERIFGRPEDDPELGSESPLFFPYLVGEHKHPAVHFGSGAFVGLQDQHERVDFANAVVEGVALATAGAWVRNGGLIGSEHPMPVGGGGVRNTAWLKAASRAFARPLQIVSEPDLSAWGAARSAATALGWIDPVEHPREWVPSVRMMPAHELDRSHAVARLQRFQRVLRAMPND